MKLKRTVALAAALCTAAALSVTAYAEQSAGTAEIYLSDSDWLVQYRGGGAEAAGSNGITDVTPVFVDGDGSYTAEITLDYEVTGLSFIALCTDFSAQDVSDDMSVVIDSVKVNGSQVEFGINGTPQWKEDGGLMRVNIYNEWTGDDADKAVEKDALAGAKTITVDFTVDGLDEETVTTAAPETEPVTETEPVPEEPAAEVIVTAVSAEEAPESDPPVNSAPMGNASAGKILSVMAVSAVSAAIFGKKSKN